jgi:hypothetical protein
LRPGQSAYLSTLNAISYIEQYIGYTYPIGYETKTILKQHIGYFRIAVPTSVLLSQRIFHLKNTPYLIKKKGAVAAPFNPFNDTY